MPLGVGPRLFMSDLLARRHGRSHPLDGLLDRDAVVLVAVAVAEATAPASTSLSPAITMNGTFCSWALRIFFCIRSSDSSTSTRIPCGPHPRATS